MRALEAERVAVQPKNNEFPEQNRMKLPGQEGHHSLFAAPDGSQIAGMEKEETQARALLNYARFRPFILYRIRQLVLSPAASPSNISAQYWRTILGLSFDATNRGERKEKKTKSEVVRDKAIAILVQTMKDAGSTVRYLRYIESGNTLLTTIRSRSL